MQALDQLIPPTYQLHGLSVIVLVKLFSEFYSSVRSGGGLKRIIMSFWFGEQVPKVIAQDYHAELTTPPFHPK